MSAWNMDFIRKLAGLPEQPKEQLNESVWDSDDSGFEDEDPDVRIASEDKGQKKFEKKNKKELKTAEVESKDIVKKKPAAEKKAEPKKEEPKKAAAKPVEKKAPAKAEPKKEEPKKADAKADDAKDDVDPDAQKRADAMWGALAKGEKHQPQKEKAEKKEGDSADKKRGRAHNPDSKQGKARDWLANNPGHTRGAFMKHMIDNHGMSKHHANTMYYAEKKRAGAKTDVKEVYFLQHPYMTTYLLGENRELNKLDWVDHDNFIEPMVFESKAEAEKMAKYMVEWKGQPAKIMTYTFEDEADAE